MLQMPARLWSRAWKRSEGTDALPRGSRLTALATTGPGLPPGAFWLVASSGASRLKPQGINVHEKNDAVYWFLNDKSDVRSSYYLEDPATEFDIQGPCAGSTGAGHIINSAARSGRTSMMIFRAGIYPMPIESYLPEPGRAWSFTCRRETSRTSSTTRIL